MDQDRPGDFSGNPTDDAKSGAHSAEPPPAQHSDAAEAGMGRMHHGFTLHTGGRNAMAATAERLGKAAGAAGRQMRRGLELVRPPASKGGTPSYTYAVSGAGRSNALQKEQDEVAGRVMEDAVAKARLAAAHDIGQLSEAAAERVLRLRERLQDAVARSLESTRRRVSEHPVQTIGALAGFCLALGVGLRVSGSRHR